MQIEGPSGELEARLDEAAAPAGITAVLCHPHPQYGGSMHDAVLQTAADVLLGAGVSCLRFNFRGVGGSAGTYGSGVGEADDLIAATQWVADQYPAHTLWWLGYSFGAAVVWRALAQRKPERVFLIAPPVGMMDFPAGPVADAPRIDAIAGDADQFVDAQKLNGLAGVTPHLIGGADHFFSGSHGELGATLGALIA